jgi:preprotein translocase subunit SecE
MRDLLNKVLEFLREAKEELRKVTWPDRDEVTNFTVVVLVAVLLMSMFLWLVDTGILEIIKIVM